MIHRSPASAFAFISRNHRFATTNRIVRVARPTKQKIKTTSPSRSLRALHVLSRPTPMGGDHNTHHREPPPTPHQPGAWNMIPTTTTKEGT